MTGQSRRNSVGDEASRRYQQARTGYFSKTPVCQAADAAGQCHEIMSHAAFCTAFMEDDFHLALRGWKVEIKRDKALASARLEVLGYVLIAGIIRNHELKTGRRFDQFPGFIDGKNPAVVCQRVDNDNCVLPRFDHFVKIADCAGANGTRERTVLPYSGVVAYQKAAHEIRRGQIIMAGHDDEGPLQAPRHMFDKTRFSTACRSFQHHGEVTQVTLREDAYLIPQWKVVRFFAARGVEALV